jgi:hypothetical protein
MKKQSTTPVDDDPLDREVDFGDAVPVRGKYARDYGRMKNIRVLAPDLLAAFPDSQSMNEALRTLVNIAQRSQGKPVTEKISAHRVSAAKRKKGTS